MTSYSSWVHTAFENFKEQCSLTSRIGQLAFQNVDSIYVTMKKPWVNLVPLYFSSQCHQAGNNCDMKKMWDLLKIDFTWCELQVEK